MSSRRVAAYAIPRVRTIANNSSTPSQPSSSSPNLCLTPDKKRKLIALYHRTDKFITAATLSQAIDEQFLLDRHGYHSRWEDSIKDLQGMVREQRLAPKMGIVSNAGSMKQDMGLSDSAALWSSKLSKREQIVRAALFGVNSRGNEAGLETVEEHREEVKRLRSGMNPKRESGKP